MRTFELADIPPPPLLLPDLEGRTAIVTGGERGIGQGIVVTLARMGMQVMAIGISGEEGKTMQARCQQEQLAVHWIEADLSEADQADRAMAQAFAETGDAHLLVNNAVRNRVEDFLDYSDETWELAFERNMRMVWRLSRNWSQRMKDRGGAIVNISSVGGSRAHRRSAAYDATKGAVDSLTRALALELAPFGIRVNAIAPGAITARPPDPARADARQAQANGIPLQRLGTVTDIAAMVAFLASEAASYVTGQILVVDGGLSAQLTPPGIYI